VAFVAIKLCVLVLILGVLSDISGDGRTAITV